MGDFADRMHAEHIDHLEEIIRLQAIEIERLTPLLGWVEHTPACHHRTGIGPAVCNCGLLEAVLAAPVDLFAPNHYTRLTQPAKPRQPDPWMRRHL